LIVARPDAGESFFGKWSSFHRQHSPIPNYKVISPTKWRYSHHWPRRFGLPM